nr:hypothetical protein [Actinomycetota bacterium]
DEEARSGKGKGKVARSDGRGSRDGKDGTKKGSRGQGGKGSIGAPEEGTLKSEDSPALQPQGEGGARFASESARYEELQPDAEKDGPLLPDYAEATAIDVKGLGSNVRITFAFDGELPQRMPNDKTYMIIAFGFSAEKKGEDGYGITAQASDEGWRASLGAKDEAKRFPGTFIVRGNTAEFTLPWSAVGGARPFEFYGSASWFQYTAGVTSYSVDPIPNDTGKYPD